MTLQESIKRGQQEFADKMMTGEFENPLTKFMSANRVNEFLATFARSVATDMAEAVSLKEVHHKINKDFGRHEPFTCMLCDQDDKHNRLVKQQSQLINNYLKGEEDGDNA